MIVKTVYLEYNIMYSGVNFPIKKSPPSNLKNVHAWSSLRFTQTEINKATV